MCLERPNAILREDNGWVNSIMSGSAQRRANGVLALIAAVALLLIAVSLFVTSNREATKYAPDTPEGVVQLYLKAIIEGKHDKAADYFVADSECDASDIDRAYVSDTLRVNLVSSEIDGNAAYVKIEANLGSSTLFESGYNESHTYRLTRESSNWRLLGIPWPLWDCGEINK